MGARARPPPPQLPDPREKGTPVLQPALPQHPGSLKRETPPPYPKTTLYRRHLGPERRHPATPGPTATKLGPELLQHPNPGVPSPEPPAPRPGPRPRSPPGAPHRGPRHHFLVPATRVVAAAPPTTALAANRSAAGAGRPRALRFGEGEAAGE